MKNIITLLIITFTLINCKAQQIVNVHSFNQGYNFGKYFKDLDNHYLPFIGVWANTTGNKTFKVILHKTTKKPMGNPVEFYMDRIEGRFLMIENEGLPNETILYDSVRYYPNDDFTFENVIIGGSADGIRMGAQIYDTTTTTDIDYLFGNLTIEILNTGNVPLQARWKVFNKGGKIKGYDFNVPTSLILTKR